MFKRILVPLDGSTNAAQAWPYGQIIAKATGAELEVLWIVESFTDIARSKMNPGGPDVDSGVGAPAGFDDLQNVMGQLKDQAQAHLDAFVHDAQAAGLTVTTVIREGDPSDVIVEVADASPDTLVVMGTHGRSGIARWVFGSVADRVIHHTSTSTLVVRSKENEQRPPESIKRVLLPADGSEVSERAIPTAVEVAKALGVGITVLRSLDIGMSYTFPQTDMGEPPIPGVDTVREEGTAYAVAIAERIRSLGIADVDSTAIDERPADAIVDEVGPEGDKLVVMGSHGRSGAGRWLLGSVADVVVRHSAGPVLIVRADEPTA
jgi:nucleotide-binding universal stress UspA family protein